MIFEKGVGHLHDCHLEMAPITFISIFRPLPTFDVEHVKEIKRKKGVSYPLWMKALLITCRI